jgi:hypothetical protein
MVVAVLTLLIVHCAWAHDDSVDDRAIKATSAERITTMREALVTQVWGKPWRQVLVEQPTSMTDHYSPTTGDALPKDLDNLDRVEQVVMVKKEREVAGNEISLTSTAFIFHPMAPNGQFVIVHQGHDCALDNSDGPFNLDAAIRGLVASHIGVVGMRMPFFQRPSACGSSDDHKALMRRRLQTGSPLQFFLDPVVRVMNYVQSKYPVYRQFAMIGLSGGGWTTTVYPAVDTRITLSLPVAGSIPLYLRGHSYPDDTEQYIADFYAIAGYKDLYIMAADASNRSQVQFLNRHDTCCFGEPQHTVGPPPYLLAVDEYSRDIRTTLMRLSAGTFTLHINQTTHQHQIPIETLQRDIFPLLSVPIPHDLEDDWTRANDMHSCGDGLFMRGVDASRNKFLCMRAPQIGSAAVDSSTQASVSYRGQQHSVHVCPEGAAMQGWEEARNQLLCARTHSALFGAQLVDGNSQAAERSSPGRTMHVCRGSGANSLMIGIQAADNVLICRDLGG